MKKDTWYITGANNQNLYVRRYEDETFSSVNGSKKVVQVLHGMAEYGDRYDNFAKYLTECGYVVYIHDHRKHGKSIGSNDKVGYYDTDTWTEMVEDIEIVQQELMTKEGIDKLMMIGHSMGSFLLRNFLIDYGERVTKAVLIGTGNTDIALTKAGLQLSIVRRKISPNKPSNTLNNLSVGKYNKAFKPNRTDLDWLTRDDNIVDWYVNSPLCGYSYTPKFYEEISKGLLYIISEDAIKQTPRIPLLFVAGEKDPVGDFGEGVKKVNEKYRLLGYDTDIELYKNARHEVLNELNKEEVYKRISNFLKD